MEYYQMRYVENIFELFKAAYDRDTPEYNKPWISSWPYQEHAGPKPENAEKNLPVDFFTFNGPKEFIPWFNWSLSPKPDYFPSSLVEPLIQKSNDFDSKLLKTFGLQYDLEKHRDAIARNNAQDYILMNAYPMPGPQVGKRILDFGAGNGRQANLLSQLEDEQLVYIGVDAIPKSYCLQHLYYSVTDRPFYDYVVDPTSTVLDDNSRGIYHLPTWRFDLIPDNYVDKIVTVQV
ncbi:MAG: hypothetical protein D6719_13360, partial [Candidatus Dadabacteria bacterium]